MDEQLPAVGEGVTAMRAARESPISLSHSRALRAWPRVATSWLLLLGGVVPGVFRSQSSIVGLALVAGVVCAFVALYLWLVLRYPFWGGTLPPAALRLRLVLLTCLTALTFLLYSLSSHRDMPPWIIVYVAIAAGVTLPIRPALCIISGATAAATVFGGVASRWGVNLISMIAGVIVVGISMIAAGRLIVTVAELHAAREEIARLAVTEERLRFARDLHDLLGHSLSTIAVKTELARRLLPTDGAAPVARQLADIEVMTRAALKEVREAVGGYRQPMLATELLGAAEILEAAGITCQWERHAGALSPAAESVLAWTVREGVTNVVRHSRAHSCTITVTSDGERACVEIINDGRDITPHSVPQGAGSGLCGLAERAAPFGGRLEAGREPDGRFRLCMMVPVDAWRTEGQG